MIKKTFTLLPLIVFFLFASCHLSKKKPSINKPLVIVTLSPYQTFVKEIAEDTVSVSCLIENGKNPHSYEPTFKDTQKIYDASIWFYLNEAFEEKVLNSVQKKVTTIDLCNSLPLLSSNCHHECHKHLKDRHLWLSPKRVVTQCETITKALIATFPKHKTLYKENLSKLISKLEILDREITSLLSTSTNKSLLVSHPAFAYFCKDYELKQLFVEQEDKELTWQELNTLLSIAKKENISTLFHQKQYNLHTAKRVSSHLNIKLETIDPFAENYFENMQLIATLFANSLRSHDKKSNRDN